MRHAKALAATVIAGPLLVGAVACSSSADTASFGPDSNPTADGGTSFSDGASPATSAPPPGPTATGVLIVHAAAFPAFRLCFENLPDQPPQPDENVMPEANVVGVEVGSLVRVDPTVAPGKVYVINEKRVRATPGQTAVPCRELVAPLGSPNNTDRSLTIDTDYHVATSVDRDLGQNKATVLAITGCGSQAFLNSLGLSNASCGADWNTTSGNLKVKVVDLTSTQNVASATALPVQLFQMSQALDTFKTAGTLSVTFGDFGDAGTAALKTEVPLGDTFTGGKQTTLAVDQTKPAFYGASGFRVKGASTFTVDESLADVQELSSPREVPTTYYQAASNYALLLLGDPSHSPTFPDGGTNTLYNPRQAVHILAVPVVDPNTADGGTDAGTTATDSGS